METENARREGEMRIRAVGRTAVLAAGAAIALFMSTTLAAADTLFLDMEGYVTPAQTAVPQDGWTNSNPELDHYFVNNTYGYPSFGTKSLRISNAVTNNNLAHTLSKPLSQEAGETGASNDGESTGPRQPFFRVNFDIASTVPNAEQPGLGMQVSADNGSGARMSWVGFFDTPDGLEIRFVDYERTGPGGTCPASFAVDTIATGLDRSVPHGIEIQHLFKNGPANDQVTVLVDGKKIFTGGSWEELYRCGGGPTHTVDSLRFLTRGFTGVAPATLGNGYLFDNLFLCSAKNQGRGHCKK
jgi:hypothetical protein